MAADVVPTECFGASTTRLLLLAGLLLGASPARPQPPISRTETGLRSLARQLVVDSLVCAGTRADELLEAVDSATAGMLRDARGRAPRVTPDSRLVCPASTEASGAPVARDRGHAVRLTVSATAVATERDVEAVLSCLFVHRGRERGFATSRTWRVRLVDGQWRVVRLVGGWIS
jgi:hypothetical protein